MTGLNENLLADLRDLLSIAEQNGLMVIYTLWDFLMGELEVQKKLLSDTQRLQSYITNALVPIVKYLANSTNLYAWEVINEPEWLNQNYGVPWNQIQSFVGRIASAIHGNCRKRVTLGSASLKWNSDVAPAVGNYWSDSALIQASGRSDGHLDFYQIHYYDWMYPLYDPYSQNLSHWKLDKPTLIGETGNTAHYTYQ